MSMQQIDPAIYDDLLNTGGAIASMDPEVARQKQLAEYLRHTFGAPPQGRMSGRIASAPHWMELLGGLAAQGVAGGKDARVQELQQYQAAMRNDQARRVLAAMEKMQQPGAQPPMPQQTPDGINTYPGTQGGY
jgi:hypothetical protein